MSLACIQAAMLNERAKKYSKKVLDSLQIQKGDTIVDIGAGGGYFTFEFAKRVGPDGKVFALDTNKAFLVNLNKMIAKKNLRNIQTALCTEGGLRLPLDCCDLAFTRNVFHHIQNPAIYFHKLQQNIKSDGRVAIIDWDTDRGYVGRTGHTTPEPQIIKAMRSAGYTHLATFDFLNQQSFNIFKVESK